CRNLIATRRPSRRSRARKTVPIPPSPIILIISYWLIRTPACGAALVAWTPVVPLPPSNVSHALLLGCDGASEPRFARGAAIWVCACGGATTGVVPGGGVPCGTPLGGVGDAVGRIVVAGRASPAGIGSGRTCGGSIHGAGPGAGFARAGGG